MAERIWIVTNPVKNRPMLAFRNRDEAVEWACRHTDVATYGVTWDSCFFIEEIVDYSKEGGETWESQF